VRKHAACQTGRWRGGRDRLISEI